MGGGQWRGCLLQAAGNEPGVAGEVCKGNGRPRPLPAAAALPVAVTLPGAGRRSQG